ncbi:MAG: hypothetical protein ABSG76_22840 [Xanthobacteraceae bacterium]
MIRTWRTCGRAALLHLSPLAAACWEREKKKRATFTSPRLRGESLPPDLIGGSTASSRSGEGAVQHAEIVERAPCPDPNPDPLPASGEREKIGRVSGAIGGEGRSADCTGTFDNPPPDNPADTTLPLLALAVGRSGDKGNSANIGIIARRPEFLPWLRAALTSQAVKNFFAHTGVAAVERFEVPGIHALNFVLHDALGGGGVASLRIDPQGKAFAQMLMDLPVPVPRAIAEAAGHAVTR